MHKLFLTAMAAGLLIACNSGDTSSTETKTDSAAATPVTEPVSLITPLTDAEKADGWALLFDGTLKGWHKWNGGAPSPGWKADSTLHLDKASSGENDGDLTSDEEFENFHLKYEWKIDTAGNSGVMFYAVEGTDSAKYYRPFYTGPEMQVLDNAKHPDSKIIKHRAGDLYDLISCSKETVKPALEWNSAEIKADKGKLDLYLNGENLVSTTMWDANWKKMISKSKFKEWPAFGTSNKGHIVLQDHGNNVWFRNIKIKKL